MLKDLIYAIKREVVLRRTDWGRKDGWLVVYKGNKIGQIEQRIGQYGFWIGYSFTLYDTSLKDKIKNWEFWDNEELFFFSRSMNEFLDHSHQMIQPKVINGEVVEIQAKGLSMQKSIWNDGIFASKRWAFCQERGN